MDSRRRAHSPYCPTCNDLDQTVRSDGGFKRSDGKNNPPIRIITSDRTGDKIRQMHHDQIRSADLDDHTHTARDYRDKRERESARANMASRNSF